MKLNEYLKNQKIGVSVFADRVGCSQSYISLLCYGRRRPSPDIAIKIEQATCGHVTLHELLFPEKTGYASGSDVVAVQS